MTMFNHKAFLELSPVAAYRTTPAGAIEWANEAMAAMLGYGSVEHLLSGRSERFYVDIAERREWQQQLERSPNGCVLCFKTSWQKPDGKIITVKNSARVIRENDKIIAYEGVVLDITSSASPTKIDSKVVFGLGDWPEEHLRDVPICASRKNLHGEITWANNAFLNREKISEEELFKSKNTDEKLYGKQAADDYYVTDQLVITSRNPQLFNDKHPFGSTEQRDVQVLKIPLFSPDRSSVVGIQIFFWEVDSLLSTFNDLVRARHHEALYKALFHTKFTMEYEVDCDGYFLDVNDKIVEVTGRPREDWVDCHFSDFVVPHCVPTVQAELNKKLQITGRHSISHYEVEILNYERKIIPLEITSRPKVEDGEIVGILGYARDLSENRELQRNRLEDIVRRLDNGLKILEGVITHAAQNVSERIAKNTLISCQGRLIVLRALHAAMFHATNWTTLNAKQLFDQLLPELVFVHQLTGKLSQGRIEVDENIALKIDTLFDLSMILNELVANAFRDMKQVPHVNPKIGVSLVQCGTDYTFSVGGDECVMDTSFDVTGSDTSEYGEQLVNALVRQLRGELRYVVGNTGKIAVLKFTAN